MGSVAAMLARGVIRLMRRRLFFAGQRTHEPQLTVSRAMEKSLLQREAELSAFEGRPVEKVGNPSSVPVVQGRRDVVYDPTNPRADWGGFVRANDARRAVIGGRASTTTLERTEKGIVGGDEAPNRGRRRFEAAGDDHTWSVLPTTRPSGDEPTTASRDAARGRQAGLDPPKRRGKRLVEPAYAGRSIPEQREARTSMLGRAAQTIASGFEEPPPVRGGHRKLEPTQVLDKLRS